MRTKSGGKPTLSTITGCHDCREAELGESPRATRNPPTPPSIAHAEEQKSLANKHRNMMPLRTKPTNGAI